MRTVTGRGDRPLPHRKLLQAHPESWTLDQVVGGDPSHCPLPSCHALWPRPPSSVSGTPGHTHVLEERGVTMLSLPGDPSLVIRITGFPVCPGAIFLVGGGFRVFPGDLQGTLLGRTVTKGPGHALLQARPLPSVPRRSRWPLGS